MRTAEVFTGVTFREFIRWERNRRGWSCARLARLVGCSYFALYHFEKGKNQWLPREASKKMVEEFGGSLPNGIIMPAASQKEFLTD